MLTGATIIAADFIMDGVVQNVLTSAWWLLGLCALFGLHALQSRASGPLGTAGLALAVVGALPQAAAPWIDSSLSLAPIFGIILAAALLAWLVGVALLGIVTLRTGALPSPWGAIPLVIALLVALSYLLPSAIATLGFSVESSVRASIFLGRTLYVLSGFGWVLLGYALWSRASERVARA